ncbi:MAG: phosphoribosyltransferase [Promethearchaeota archaeon]
MTASYTDREEAGFVLAKELQTRKFEDPPLVLAIPNGGLAVALPIANTLGAQLDLLIVRKLQIPYNPEAGFGAITSLGTIILNKPLVARIGLNQDQIDSVIERTQVQIENRKQEYGGVFGHHSPEDKIVILVDDGLASGYTMLAAIQSVRNLTPRKILVATPTASASAVSLIRDEVDDLICPHIGSGYVFAVADAYDNWYDVSDTEVIELLQSIRQQRKESD